MIGKTRHTKSEQGYDPEVGQARGVFRRPMPAGSLRHSRKRPAADVAGSIAHYWAVSWRLGPGEQHVAETLPHPNVHMILETDGLVVAGVHTRKFSRVLRGQSQVFGIKFRPGGFRPFIGMPVWQLTGRILPASCVLNDAAALEAELATAGTLRDKIQAADQFFRQRVPAPDQTSELASALVDRILAERDIRTVDELASRTGIGKRSLQRIFKDYVGVSPKWVIRRYRLHEVMEKVNGRERLDWAQAALELGYYDQAHLIRDFKSMTDYSPAQYQKLFSEA